MREREHIHLANLQQGDPETVHILVQRNQPILVARAFFLMRLLPPPRDTQGLVQDTWFKFFRAVYGNRIKSDADPKWDTKYLLTIEQNRFIDQWKSRKPFELVIEITENTIPINSIPQPTPEEEVVSNESCNNLLDKIDELPDESREIIIFRAKEKLSYSEIADRLGVNRSTAGTKIHRARRKLQAALA